MPISLYFDKQENLGNWGEAQFQMQVSRCGRGEERGEKAKNRIQKTRDFLKLGSVHDGRAAAGQAGGSRKCKAQAIRDWGLETRQEIKEEEVEDAALQTFVCEAPTVLNADDFTEHNIGKKNPCFHVLCFQPGSKFKLCHLLAVCPQKDHLLSSVTKWYNARTTYHVHGLEGSMQ